MRAVQVQTLDGPDAVVLADVPEPPAEHPMSPGAGVVVEVHATGVSFPELLQTRGLYQYRPPLPFVPGCEVAGVVVGGTEGTSFSEGDRVMAFPFLGAWADRSVSPPGMVWPLPDVLDFAQGAAIPMNYHTAWFALTTRGRVQTGETVLVHGAAGGVGTATIQVARGLGARTIALVSTEEKAAVAKEAGADEVVLVSDGWKDEVKGHGGADVVIDPVGGDRFTDSLRSLNEGGRLVVVGFTGGSIPEVKVNRLLLNNVEVVGAGWGAYAMSKPAYVAETAKALHDLIEAGHIRPIIGARFPLEQAADALNLLDSRGATGKVVLELR